MDIVEPTPPHAAPLDVATVELLRTCFICPEQYDLLAGDGSSIGYFRLRHGCYVVRIPDAGGEPVYVRRYDGPADANKGGFDTDEERVAELRRGVRAVLKANGISHPKRAAKSIVARVAQ